MHDRNEAQALADEPPPSAYVAAGRAFGTTAEHRAVSGAASVSDAISAVVTAAKARGFEIDAGSLDSAEYPRCFTCNKTAVKQSGRNCEPCMLAARQSERAERARTMWIREIPESMRWTRLSAKQLPDWVRDGEAIAAAQAWLPRRYQTSVLTLVGEAGAGKTTLACAVLSTLIGAGLRPGADEWARRDASSFAFAVSFDLTEAVRNRKLGTGNPPELDRAHHARILVLDELRTAVNDHAREVINSLIHERHRERRLTVITTPHDDREDIAKAFDGGVARRVYDDSTLIHVRKMGARDGE